MKIELDINEYGNMNIISDYNNEKIVTYYISCLIKDTDTYNRIKF